MISKGKAKVTSTEEEQYLRNERRWRHERSGNDSEKEWCMQEEALDKSK